MINIEYYYTKILEFRNCFFSRRLFLLGWDVGGFFVLLSQFISIRVFLMNVNLWGVRELSARLVWLHFRAKPEVCRGRDPATAGSNEDSVCIASKRWVAIVFRWFCPPDMIRPIPFLWDVSRTRKATASI